MKKYYSISFGRGCKALKRMCFYLIMASVLLVQNVASAQTASPNCVNLNLSVGLNDSAAFQVMELVTNSGVAAPMNVLIENEFGGRLFFASGLSGADVIQLPGCTYRNQTLKVTVSNNISRCWGEITFKVNSGYNLSSNLDTMVWCNDHLALLDPNDLYDEDWYTTTYPYTLLPTAYVPCSRNDKILESLYDVNRDGTVDEKDARDWYAPRFEECNYYAIDWTIGYHCNDGTDTAKIIIREWEAYDEKGNRSVTTDTIRLIKLPDLTAGGYIHAPQKDTIYCELYEVENDTMIPGYLCWKQLVGLHSDGTYIFYPKADVDDIIADANNEPEVYEYLRDRIIIRDVSEGLDYNIFNLPSLTVNVGPDGKPSYVFKVGHGDHVMTNNGDYLEVDDNWFYQEEEHGFWVDLCIPDPGIEERTIICDRWEEVSCPEGAQVILPNHPYNPTGCTRLCMEPDILADVKCFTTIHTHKQSLSYGCPRIDKQHYEIKQSCYSTGTATLGQLNSCDYTADESGIVEINEEHHTIKVEQWRTYIDNIAPQYVDIYGRNNVFTWSTGEYDCLAEVRVPRIMVKDDCSGVKQVKARIAGLGWVNLHEDDHGFWYHAEYARSFELSCGTYEVEYELIDGCHNKRVISPVVVRIEDNTPPNVVTDDNLTVSLGGKRVWLPAESLDEGSSDNCGIRKILARRTDWAEACGVDLCNSYIEELETLEELEDYLNTYGIESVLSDNEVERFYLREYEWIRDDEEFCDIDGDGYTHDDNYVVEGWELGVKKYWAEHCAKKGHYGKINVDDYSVGGGWSTKVPFCCEDACNEITVELLVIDKDCNYSKGWLTVKVEDKSPVYKACEFDDLKISCSSYHELYKDAIDAAIAAGNSSKEAPEEFAALDEMLGGLVKGWRGPDGETLVDYEGHPIDKELEYSTTRCEYVVEWVKEYKIDHDGKGEFVYVYDTSMVYDDVVDTAQLGGVYITCAAICDQDIWLELNDCGVGTITRRWQVYTGCGEHEATPLVFEQKIYVDAGCDLNKHMFNTPQDSTVCGKLSYDGAGNVVVDAGQLEYIMEDANCREMGIGYSDDVFEVIGAPGRYKIHRNWTVSDWCTGEEIHCLQKIVLDESDECDDTQPGDTTDASRANIAGFIETSYDQGKIQQVEVVARLAGGESQTSVTGADGTYDFKIEEGASVTITPRKSINLLNGVDIVDIILIQNHIVGKSTLTGDYINVAADVNKDGRINGLDIIAIQRVTLEKDNSFPNNDSWRFFNSITGEESYALEASANVSQVDFVGVKIGDVNQQGVNLARSSAKAVFTTENMNLSKGQSEVISLNKDATLTAYQFALKYDPSKVKITAVQGAGLTTDNWNIVRPGELRVSYIGDAGESVQVSIEALDDVTLSEVLAISDAEQFQSIGATEDNQPFALELAFASDDQFSLYQNNPNPVTSGYTDVRFVLPNASSATLSFFDASGKLLNVVEGDYTKGLNTVSVSVDDLGAAGVVYYQLETGQFTQTKKMVVIK